MHPPPPRKALLDTSGTTDRLMGSRSGLLSSCHLNTEASQPPILEDKHLLCRLFFLSLFLYKNNHTLDQTIFLPKKHKWLNRYSSAGRSASGRAPW